MKYTMKVTIYDPEIPQGFSSDLQLVLKVCFTHNPDTYGNGHHVIIRGKMLPFGREIYDLRYSKTFDRNHKEEWLEDWAYFYWSGKRGAYKLKKIEILKGCEE